MKNTYYKIGAIILLMGFMVADDLDKTTRYVIVGGKKDGWTIEYYSGSSWNYYRPNGDYYSYTSLTHSSYADCDNNIKKNANGEFQCNKNSKLIDIRPDKLPPVLKIENIALVKDGSTMNQFSENPSDVLLGGESGFIEFDITNHGKGTSKILSVYMTGSHTGNITIRFVGEDESYHVKFPISAPLSTENDTYRYTLNAIDYNEFEASSREYSVDVREVATPDFTLDAILIDDDQEGGSWGNNNGLINKGEAIEVTFIIKNIGNGPASNTIVEVVQNEDIRGFFLSPDQALSFNVLEFKERSEKSFSFSFLTNKKTGIRKVPIEIKITEQSGEFGKIFDCKLTVNPASVE